MATEVFYNVFNSYKEFKEDVEKLEGIIKKFVSSEKEEKAKILLEKTEDIAILIAKESEIIKEAKKAVKKAKEEKDKKELKKISNQLSETSKHQIRKHFHRLLDIKERMKADNSDNIKKFLPEIAMTSAYATYDRSRNRIGVAFEKFLKEFTNEAVKADKKKFFDLMTLFEAVVGYSNMYVSKN